MKEIVAAILIWTNGNSYGDTVSMQKFDSMDECVIALNQMEKYNIDFHNGFFSKPSRNMVCRPLN